MVLNGEDSTRWQTVDDLVRGLGYSLFDIEFPSGHSGVMRVFITSLERGTSIGVADCAKVSKAITALPNVDEVVPGELLLEVSSPGINRTLRRPEHFEGAQGERVRLVRRGDGAQRQGGVTIGVLERCETQGDDLLLHVQDERSRSLCVLPMREVSHARTDFLFNDKRER